MQSAHPTHLSDSLRVCGRGKSLIRSTAKTKKAKNQRRGDVTSASVTNFPRRRLFQRAWDRLRHADWRVWAVLGAVVVSVIATGALYYYHLGLDPATHFGAVFASWVGGVALFVVAGAVVAIVSLARPEEDSFDARARILFRRKTGNHIEYIINRIGSILEQYAESQILKVRIEKYHEPTKTFFVTLYNNTIIRGYIDDIFSTYHSPLEYEEVTIPPPGEQSNSLTLVRIQGKPLGYKEVFTTHILREITTVVSPNDSAKLEFEIAFWVRANNECNSQICVRYTHFFRLSFENVLPVPVKIEIKNPEGTRWDQIIINPGEEPKTVHAAGDLKPGVTAVEYRILEP
jgi:hypothetical protein